MKKESLKQSNIILFIEFKYELEFIKIIIIIILIIN